MKKPNIKDVNLSLETKKQPSIFFGSPSESYYGSLANVEDLCYFPALSIAVSRFSQIHKQEHLSIISKNFQLAISQAIERVWIIDTYLGNTLEIKNNNKLENFYKLISTNPNKLNVKFFFKRDSDKDKNNRLDALANQYNNEIRIEKKHPNTTIIEYKCFNDIKFIHDRFAIIDNSFWHFGSDVGASQPSLHATSYNWDAEELKVIKFFEHLWESGK